MSVERQFAQLGKIVALAKRGVGGEKATALKMVRTICKRHSLDFDEVMNDVKLTDHCLVLKTRNHFKLGIQIVAHYGIYDEDHLHIGESLDKKHLYFETMQEKYIETINAYEVLSRLYEKEKKRMNTAFILGFYQKHDLFLPFKLKKNKGDKRPTEKEMEEYRRGAKLAEDMEDAKIQKLLN